jgi:hypothetical protein
MTQPPSTQFARACVKLQALLHAPQWRTSVRTSCSQPSLRWSPFHSSQPTSQTPVHCPGVHAADATWLVEQAALQAPQLAESSAVCT